MLKICTDKNNIHLLTGKEIWSFTFHFPDSIGLGYCLPNQEEEDRILKKGINVSPYFQQSLLKYIEPSGLYKEGNYYKVCNILKPELNLTQDDLDKIFEYDKEAIDLCKSLKLYWEFSRKDYYSDCKQGLKEWNGDKERVKKYIEKVLDSRYMDNAMVDIFPTKEDTERPTWQTEYFLLHKFHNSWGDNLDNIIKEAVTQYPNFSDRDLAYYFVKEELNKENEKIIEHLKNKKDDRH